MYKRLFLLYRYPAEQSEDPVKRLLREGRRDFRAQGELDLAGEPSWRIMRWLNEAIQILNDWELYDHTLPHEGGLLDQPALWKMALDCAIRARNAAQAERKTEKEADTTPDQSQQ